MFLANLKLFFKRLFRIKNHSKPAKDFDQDIDMQSVEPDTFQDENDEGKKFEIRNIVYEKLNYLEQYIKIFSLPFPNEYAQYLESIQNEKRNYETELNKYSDGLNGKLTFAIDPEEESSRLMRVSQLERQIQDFVELVVNYHAHKDKFSAFCVKLNKFYNALLDSPNVSSQLSNAVSTLDNIVVQVKSQRFFKEDQRKQEEILNFIIYSEYIFFKTSLRCMLANTFEDYKSTSSFYHLFKDLEYDSFIFKFFINDLEQCEEYITNYLEVSEGAAFLLAACQELQNRLQNYHNAFSDSSFFKSLIQFENTIDNISDNNGKEFVYQLPASLDSTAHGNDISVKSTAISILSMLVSNKACILCNIIKRFEEEISWKEFFFMTKIFELYDDVCNVSQNTIFDFVHTKFAKLEKKYPSYTAEAIRAKKQQILAYNGSKRQKYIRLIECTHYNPHMLASELKALRLDFTISDNVVYLNHTYFNGFKNLEKNFGEYKFWEDI